MKQQLNRFPILSLFCFLGLWMASCGPRQDVSQISTSVIFFDGTVEQALEKARSEKKKVFVVGYTNWCKYCKVLFRETLTSPEVGEYMNPRFVSLKLNMETSEGKRLAKEWNVTGFPTSLVLSSDGTVENAVAGTIKPEGLLDFLKKTE